MLSAPPLAVGLPVSNVYEQCICATSDWDDNRLLDAGSSQHGDILSRLEYDEQERRLKLQGLREEQERRELAECTSPVIDGKSKYLASGWAARGLLLRRAEDSDCCLDMTML